MHRVFVFGTLKRGFGNHDEGLSGQTCVGLYRTACAYPLVIAGPWFTPMMMPEPGVGHVVTGELYEVDDATLAVLDRMEAVHRPDGYRRLNIEIVSCADEETVSAWAYFRDRSLIGDVHSEYLSDYTDRRYIHRSQRPQA